MISHYHLFFTPQLPVWLLATLAVVAGALCLYALYRRSRGSIVRALSFTLILLALADPALIHENREALKDTALLVIDDSASMQLGDRATQSAQAAAALGKKLAAFNDLTVEALHVTGAEQTDLFHAIDGKLATVPHDRLAGIIAITDGQIHDAPQGSYSAPFHVLLAGHRQDLDRRLHIISAPGYGIVGKSVAVKLRIDDAPEPQATMVTVTLQRDDGQSDSLNLPIGKTVDFTVPISHAGKNLFVFSTPALPGELTEVNNTVGVTVNGIRDRLRVLLVSGEPHIGTRSWRNLLKSDPSVDLVHFTILRSPAKQDMTPQNQMALIAFPVHELFETKLKSFDLVIFDRFRNQSLVPDAYLDNIAHYVQDGGALLVSSATDEAIPGLTQSPLAQVLPTEPGGSLLTGTFVPDLTKTGKRHPVTATLAQSMPRAGWGPWLRQNAAQLRDPDQVKPQVLMTGINQQPLLVLAHVGQGRVAQFLSDQFWLWARNYQGGGPEAELLRRLTHWLVQEPELDENALEAHAEHTGQGWQIAITLRSLDQDSATVQVVDSHDQARRVTLTPQPDAPGLLQATVPAPEAGLYHVKTDSKDILVLAGPVDAPEYGEVVATPDKVAPVADASKGSVLWLEDSGDGPSIKRIGAGDAAKGWGWIGLKQNRQYRITGSTATPLLPVWLLLGAILGFVLLAWRREGKSSRPPLNN